MNAAFSLDLEDFQVAVHDALATWGEIVSSDQEQLSSLLLIQEERHKMGDNLSQIDYRRATNQVLLNAIDDLREQDELKAKVLEARFV